MNEKVENPGLHERLLARNAEDRRKTLAEQNRLKDLQWLLQDKRGRNVLRLIQEACLEGKEAIHPTSSTVYVNLGRQKVWHEIQADLMRADFDLYLFFLKENWIVGQSPTAKGNNDGT